MKALFVFMLIVLALLLCSADATAVGKFRGRQVVRQKTVVRGAAARGIGANVQQTTVIGGGMSANLGIQAQQSVGYGAPLRQRSFQSTTVYGGAAMQLYAPPAQLLAAPVYVQPQAAIIQPPAQIYVQPSPVLQVQAAPVLLQSQIYAAPVVQFDVAPVCPSCLAPGAGFMRQRTFTRNY